MRLAEFLRRSTQGRAPRGCFYASLALWAFGPGCGLLVDTDRFRTVPEVDGGLLQADGGLLVGDGGRRAADGGGSEPDASPTLEPAVLREGAGGSVDLGRGVPLVVRGASFAATTVVVSEDPRLVVSAATVATAGDRLAVRAWIRPDPALAFGRTATVTLWVDDVPLRLQIRGLNELELAGNVDGASLEPRYSQITTTAPVRFTGDAPVRLVAEARIAIAHPVSVAADGPAPGPGGTAGGAPGEPGDGERGGREGGSVGRGCAGGGGGGGGRRTGESARNGARGGATSDGSRLSMVDLVGHGGGGGGASGDEAGQPGGGGGGGVYIEAPVVRLEAPVEAAGGAGGDAIGNGCGGDRAGAGGGGSGGWIYVGAHHVLVKTATVSVRGGAGGDGQQRTGGAGSPGWFFLDAPTEFEAGSVFRGPAWSASEPRVGPGAELRFVSAPEDELAVTVDGRVVGSVVTDQAGRGAVTAPTAAGLYDVCVAISLTALARGEELEECISIAVMP